MCVGQRTFHMLFLWHWPWTRSITYLELDEQARQAGKPQGPAYLRLSSARLTGVHYCALFSFFLRVLGS